MRCQCLDRPHPGPMASQARHELVSTKKLCASRIVVHQERENASVGLGDSGSVVADAAGEKRQRTAALQDLAEIRTRREILATRLQLTQPPPSQPSPPLG